MEEILKLIKDQYQKWQQDPKRQSSGYAYEESFTKMWLKCGKEVFQQSVGKLPKDKNVKKNSKPHGEK